jgi:ribosome biogenesis GTPase
LKGLVHRVRGGVYTVALESGEVLDASLRGRLKLEKRTGDQVVIGDRVRVAGDGDGAHTIEEIFPRRTSITRTRFGGRSVKVLVANADRMLVVVAAARPKTRRDLIDRLLVVGESGGVASVLVVNKMDLEGALALAEELEAVYEPIGYEVIRVSALAGEGLDRFGEQICEGIAVLAGPSGVGKSSLVNAFEPEHELRTGELSRKRGTGRHTTVNASLIQLGCGGLVADTPGFSDVGIWGVGRAELDGCFPEFRPLVENCRFRGCSHIHEPDCAVRSALEEGTIDSGRYESYRLIFEESGP